ncbi:intein splicing region, partial [Teladorsagia circumcincta]
MFRNHAENRLPNYVCPNLCPFAKNVIKKCDFFKETVCTGDLEWTGGLMEINNGTHNMYEGGIVQTPDNNSAFDLIKEVRKTVNSDKKMQYIVTVHRFICANHTIGQEGSSRGISRNKRRLNNEKKERDNYDEWMEHDNRYRGAYGQPVRRRHPPPYRRRPSVRAYDDDYYDYEYEVYVPRIPRRRAKGNRLWPFARAHADGGIFDPNDIGTSQVSEPDLTVIDSNSRALDLTQVPAASNSQGPPIGDPLPPTSYQQPQQLPQYVPAYREPPTYAPAYPTAPPMQPQFRAQQVAVQQAPQAQQYYNYYPSGYNPGLNTIFDQMQCFSGEMKVETPSGMKAIKDLEVGDMVLSIDEFMVTFSPVIMFLHKLEEERAEFLHIQTDHGESLKLTENHLLYVTNCGSTEPLHLAAAKDARAGQCLQVTTGNSDLIPRRITSISKVATRLAKNIAVRGFTNVGIAALKKLKLMANFCGIEYA